MMTSERRGLAVYRYPKIVVAMTDEDVIARAAKMLAGSVYTLPPSKQSVTRKQAWRTQAFGVKAAEWMETLYPWMGTRRRQRIDEVLGEYGSIESTAVRRSRACREAALRRYAVKAS